MILMRSTGATTVLATIPARPPVISIGGRGGGGERRRRGGGMELMMVMVCHKWSLRACHQYSHDIYKTSNYSVPPDEHHYIIITTSTTTTTTIPPKIRTMLICHNLL